MISQARMRLLLLRQSLFNEADVQLVAKPRKHIQVVTWLFVFPLSQLECSTRKASAALASHEGKALAFSRRPYATDQGACAFLTGSREAAIQFYIDRYHQVPLNCHEYPLDFELARGKDVISFRNTKKEL